MSIDNTALWDFRDTFIRVPGQPYGYPAATHNAITSLTALVQTLRQEVAALRVDVGKVSTPNPQVLANLLAGPIASAVAPMLTALPDSDLERIRDAAVEALELSKGTLNTSTNVMRFSRVAQP